MAKIGNISMAFALGAPVVAGFGAVLLASPAAAQVTPTGGTTVAPVNSVPVVTIVAPTNGVSHNTYTEFNTPASGLVLNNCATSGGCGDSAIIVGYSPGFNTNLGSGAANLILNEVTAANPSQLLGKIETYGHAADFVLANPAGVTCDGCGFINTPRATLTTGTPTVDGGTGAVSFSITGGNVTIGSGGADTSGLTYFDVIASSIALQGSIGKKNVSNGSGEIGLFTGGKFDYSSRTVSDSSDSAPAVAIDSNALGGAYAGKIQLVSTQAGAGVNTPDLQAGAGGIRLSADGKITIGNSAQNQQTASQGGIIIETTSAAGDIEIANTVTAAGGLTLSAAGALSVNSGVTAGNTAMSAGASITNNGTISSTGNSGSSIVAGTSFSNYGQVSSLNDEITITAQAGDLTNNAGGLIEARTLKLAAAATLSNKLNSRLTARADIEISAQTLDNQGSIQAGDSTSGNLTASVSGLLNNDAGADIGSKSGDASLTAGSVTNAGTISSQNTTGVTATSGDLTNSGAISGQSLNASAAGGLWNNPGGELTSTTGGMTLSAHTISNASSISASSTLDVHGTADLVNTGTIAAKGKLTANLSGDLANTNSISAESADVAAAGDLTNTGTITAEHDASINVGGTLTNGATPTPTKATIHAGGTLNIQAGALKNYGDADFFKTRGEISGMYLNIQTTGDLQNMGNLFAGQDMTIRSANIANGFGWIKAGGHLFIATRDFNNVAGLIQASSMTVSAETSENVVLVRPDDETLFPKKRTNVIRPANAQDIVQAIAGWDKAVLARFGATDNKALDNLRLQLGEPVFPQPGEGAGGNKHSDATAGARRMAQASR